MMRSRRRFDGCVVQHFLALVGLVACLAVTAVLSAPASSARVALPVPRAVPSAAVLPTSMQNGLIVADTYYGTEAVWPEQPFLSFQTRGQETTDQTDPTWSPDGRLLAYADVVNEALYVTDRSGADRRDIAPFAALWDGDLAWTPDGRLLAGRSLDHGFQTVELWLMNADGSDATLLLDAAEYSGRSVTVSPDGASLAFARRSAAGGYELVRLDLATKAVTVLDRDPGFLGFPDWSPDGGTIAFQTQEGLWMVQPDGSGLRQVLPDSTRVRHLAWSPDGTKIAFGRYFAETDYALWALTVATGAIEQIPLRDFRTGSLDWQPLPPCSVNGTDGPDQLEGTSDADVICAGGGDDVITATPGDDVILGGAGDDTVSYETADTPVAVDLYRFDGRHQGQSQLQSVEAVDGGAGADTLLGGIADETLRGGDGDDLLRGGSGADSLDGGAGSDTAWFDNRDLSLVGDEVNQTYDIDLAAGTATSSVGVTDSLSGVENVDCPGWYNTIRGDENPNVLSNASGGLTEGRGGDDTLKGPAYVTYADAPGPVRVDLVAGTASGADGNDRLVGSYGVYGSAFDDQIVVPRGSPAYAGAGDDLLRRHGVGETDGGAGTDTLDVSSMTTPVLVARVYEYWSSDNDAQYKLASVEKFTLTAADDTYWGSDDADWVHAGAGPDWLDGAGGSDLLYGEAGKDFINDGAGADVVRGGAGDDTARPEGGPDQMYGGTGTDLLRLYERPSGMVVDLQDNSSKGAGDDQVYGFEDIWGSNFEDVLRGDAGPNHISGMKGQDILRGRAGPDILDATGGGADLVDGGTGTDRCYHSPNDTLTHCP